jgi:hypothetical protein
MSLFPAYSGNDSVPWEGNEQETKKDDAVGTGLLRYKGFYVWRGG